MEKKFPGLVTISIKEYSAVAYELDQDGVLEAILSSGAAVSVNETGIAVEKPILTSWGKMIPIKPNCARLSPVSRMN